METYETAACFVGDGGDLLDFNVGDDYHEKKPGAFGCSLPEFGEEDLEWLSNKDAFPTIDDILPDPTHQSPVSVLENNSSSSSAGGVGVSKGSIIIYCSGSLRVPVRARSSTRRRRCRPELLVLDSSCWVRGKGKGPPATSREAGMGRKCQHCGSEKTPQWRAGPTGPKTLCNACGVRFKSGRLVPEYRPACSPTFSSEMHSNSHKKILEMRRQKLSGFEMGSVNKD